MDYALINKYFININFVIINLPLITFETKFYNL